MLHTRENNCFALYCCCLELNYRSPERKRQVTEIEKKKNSNKIFLKRVESVQHHIHTTTKMAPVQRPDNIATMINGVERYNPENVEVLEEYLSKQCESGEYDLEANLAILKL